MRRFRLLLIVVLSAVALVGTGCWITFQATQSVPDFYEEALVMTPEVADRAGAELEKQVLSLHNELQEGEQWTLQMSDQQVNGWLSSDLNEKFPNLLPKEVQEPRIVFRENQAQVACRLKLPKFSGVLSIHLEAYLTEEPNQIAIRIRKVRAGSIPVPLDNLLARIATAMHRAGIRLNWTQADGDPVALVKLPTDRPDLRSGVTLTQLTLSEGKLVAAGTAAPAQSRVAESDGDNVNSQH